MSIEKISINNHNILINEAIDLADKREWEELIKSLKNFLEEIISNKPNIEIADELIEKTEQLNDLIVGEKIPDNLSEKIKDLQNKIVDNL